MLELTREQMALFRGNSERVNLAIEIVGRPETEWIYNDRIYQESLEIVEKLNDDTQLVFGSCDMAELKIRVADLPDNIKGKDIKVRMTIDTLTIPLGCFTVSDVKKTTDKRYKDITAYDYLYKTQIDVAGWYNGLFPTVETTLTLKQFRDSFFAYVGITQELTTLPNDEIIVHKTIDTETINGYEIIKAICEVNGCFGHIDRNGVFRYKYLTNHKLYPSMTLYPSSDLRIVYSEQIMSAQYIPPCEISEYTVKGINKLQVRQTSDDIGVIIDRSADYGYANSYIIEDNMLLYGNTQEELTVIADRIADKIFGISYRPINVKLKSLPYMEVGDCFDVQGKNEKVASLLLTRTIKGIQAMRDSFVSEGVETYPEVVTNNNKEIIKLRQRTNELQRTVDGTVSTVTRIESDLSSNYYTKTETNSQIEQTANGITSTVSSVKTTADNAKSTADSVASDLSNNYYTKTETNSQITQLADSISLQVTNKTDGTGASIVLNVNGKQIQGGSVDITGFVTFNNLSTQGQTTINGANITTGTIKAERIGAGSFQITGGTINITTSDSLTNYMELNNALGSALYKPHSVTITSKSKTEESYISYAEIRTTMLTDYKRTSKLSNGSLMLLANDSKKLEIKGRPDGYAEYNAPAGHEFKGHIVTGDDIILVYNGSFHSLTQMLISHGWL